MCESIQDLIRRFSSSIDHLTFEVTFNLHNSSGAQVQIQWPDVERGHLCYAVGANFEIALLNALLMTDNPESTGEDDE